MKLLLILMVSLLCATTTTKPAHRSKQPTVENASELLDHRLISTKFFF